MFNNYEATNWWEIIPTLLFGWILALFEILVLCDRNRRLIAFVFAVCLVWNLNHLKPVTPAAAPLPPPVAQPASAPAMPRPVILKYSPFVRADGK